MPHAAGPRGVHPGRSARRSLAYSAAMDEHASAIDTAAAIRAKEVSPLEVLDATLARIDARNPDLNAVIWRNDDDARAEARALGDRIAGGATDLAPFAGVPLPIKDLLPVAGQPVTFGSMGAAVGPAEQSEPVATAFVDAGFILCGRTNAPEFGSVTVTENTRFGATRNPWGTACTPGGSSGGAASSVASGMFAAAHAGDGGGSIRIPASCCGLVGHKPSRGRVADTVPGWSGLTTEGVLTRTVADSAAILDVISHPDPLAWWSPPGQGATLRRGGGADPGRLRVAVNTVSALGVEVAAGGHGRRGPRRRAARVARSPCHPPRRRPVRPGRPRPLPPPDERRLRRAPGHRPRRHGAPQPGLLRGGPCHSTASPSPFAGQLSSA